MIRLVPIKVGCYEGSKAEETPRWFTLNEQRFDIEEIVDRWYQASQDPTVTASDYYKVRTVEGTLFVIRRDRETLAWQLVEGK
ncbi:MAG: hypothetical protein NT005_02750 [Spirochaetes bacterium]|nr:hypothetical protein [Spirochaetota bacterium]